MEQAKVKTVWIINHYAQTPEQGGLSRHYFFAKELIARGYNVRIFTSSVIHNSDINMIDESEKILFKDVDQNGVPYTYIKSSAYKGNGLARIKNMLGFAFDIKKIWKTYKQEKPDVIYTSTPDLLTAWQAQNFAKKHKLPCVVEVRDLWPLSIVEYNNISSKNPIIIALYMLEKRIYKRADALVFTMPGGKDYIIDKKWDKKVALEKIFNINNGIDVEEQERQVKENAFSDPDLDDGSFKVIYCGSIRPANNVKLLVDAAKVVEKKRSDIKFLIYGGGIYAETLKIEVKEKGMNNVFFKGYVDKKYIPYIVSKASLNVLTYKNTKAWKYGGSQNKVFDYMNAGKPILTNIKMGRSVLAECGCGIEVDTDNAEKFANAIIEAHDLPQETRLDMGARGKEKAKEFDFKVLTDKFEQVINYAIEQEEK